MRERGPLAEALLHQPAAIRDPQVCQDLTFGVRGVELSNIGTGPVSVTCGGRDMACMRSYMDV